MIIHYIKWYDEIVGANTLRAEVNDWIYWITWTNLGSWWTARGKDYENSPEAPREEDYENQRDFVVAVVEFHERHMDNSIKRKNPEIVQIAEAIAAESDRLPYHRGWQPKIAEI